MKLKTVKNCRIMDQKKGLMINLAIGETIDIDHTEREQAEIIHNLLYSGKVVITDEKFIKPDGRYKILRAFHYQTADGFPRVGRPGSEIILNQEKACELLLSGCVEPIDRDGWTPKKLLEPVVRDNPIKRMFDLAEPPTKNWTMEYGKKGGG